MTNPYEDLFRTAVPTETAPVAAPDPETDPLDDLFKTRRTNFLLLAAYVLALVIVNVAMYGIFLTRYDDPAAVTENIVAVDVTYQFSESDLYEGYPFAVSVAGRFENHNPFALGSVYADFSFYDADGGLVGSSSYSADDVAEGDGLVVEDTLYFDAEVASIAYDYGFDMSSGFYLAVNAIHGFFLAVAFVYIDRDHLADRWRRFRKNWKNMVGHIVMGEAQVYLVLILANFLMEQLGLSTGSQNEATIASMFKPDVVVLVTLFFTLCVFTPIVEETIFRKVLFGFFPKRLGPIVPILVSGIVFGLMHVVSNGDYLQSIPYVLMGFVFGWVYWSSGRNVYVTMGVHFLNNLISYLIYVAMIYGTL